MVDADAQLREAILESQVEAALQGHEIGPFEPVDTMSGGYEAGCRHDKVAWLRQQWRESRYPARRPVAVL